MKKRNTNSNNLVHWVQIILGSPWVEVLSRAWRLGQKILRGFTSEGMYEVLDYESTLEIHDSKGKRASFRKRKKIRYLQNNIIAYQDYGWCDGKFLTNYRSMPGAPVDQYKLGYKTYVLLSLREVKDRGDIDEYFIEWEIRDGFLKSDGFWETDISNRTKRISVSVIFPEERPPLRLILVEANQKRTHTLGQENQHKLPDGRWQVTWEKQKPKLYEHYVLGWDW